MNDEITYQLKKAYHEAKRSRDFIKNFNFRVQNIIARHTGRQVVSLEKGARELLHLQKISRSKSFSSKQYLKLIRGYVLEMIKRYREEHR